MVASLAFVRRFCATLACFESVPDVPWLNGRRARSLRAGAYERSSQAPLTTNAPPISAASRHAGGLPFPNDA